MTHLDSLIKSLPKAELHLHLEGSLEPELLFSLAKKNDVDIPFSSVEEVRAAFQFSNLQDFLDIYYQGMNVLRTEQDFYDLTFAYLEKAAEDNVRHVEVFFDPQGHTERGVAFGTVITGISNALRDGKAKLGISSYLIMCFLRHLSEDEAFQTLSQAEPWIDLIEGVGLDSSEVGHPPSKFERVFTRAGEMGLKRVAHAGEEGPPEYIYEALDLLNIDRIDHGNTSIRDQALIERIVGENLTLTMCPLSNIKLCVHKDLSEHPGKKLLDAGVRVTLNSDDPSYFGGYMNDNFEALAAALDLDANDVIKLARNSIEGSFLPESEKQPLLKEIEDVAVRALA